MIHYPDINDPQPWNREELARQHSQARWLFLCSSTVARHYEYRTLLGWLALLYSCEQAQVKHQIAPQPLQNHTSYGTMAAYQTQQHPFCNTRSHQCRLHSPMVAAG
jgi:hypothetical protein